MQDQVPFRAWLVGIRGIEVIAPGIGADLARLSRLVVSAGGQAHVLASAITLTEATTWAQAKGFDFAPIPYSNAPDAGPAIIHRGAASLQMLGEAVEAARAFAGHRLFWLGGHAVPNGLLKKLAIPLEGGDDAPIPVADLWELLELNVGDRLPLVALLDTCHAGEARLSAESRVLGLAASRPDQKARGTPNGGAFTQALCEAVEQGQGTLRRARDFIADRLGGAQTVRAIGGTDDLPDHPILPGLGGAPSLADPLAACRAWLKERCRRLPSVLGNDLDQTVYVEVCLHAEEHKEFGRLRGRTTLDDLLEHTSGARFSVLGEPGSGKSTLARHLTWQRAQHTGGPVVLYLPAADLAHGHPFDRVAEDVAGAEGRRAVTHLVTALHTAADKGRLWLLLDGLDEVPAAEAERVRARILHHAAALPRATLVVLARAIGFKPLEGFVEARVQDLDHPARVDLLRKHGVDRPKATLDRIEAIEALRLIAGVPLLLSFIALVARERRLDLPRTRAEVYDRALLHFLTRGRSEAPPLTDPKAARQVLAHLALALQAEGGGAWPEETLVATLERLEDGEIADGLPEIFKQIHDFKKARLTARRKYNARSPGLFVRAVADATGLLAPYDGEGKPWRFLHKTLHDALGARLLAERPEAELIALVETLDRGALTRWAETLAQVIALRPAPLALLQAYGRASESLLLRCAPEVDGVAPAELLALVVATEMWTGEHLLTLVRHWQDEPEGIAAIRALATPKADLERVARVHYALSEAGCLGDEAAFFAEVDRPLPTVCPIESWVRIPGGTFRMGTADGGYDWERPVHEVTLSPFELGTFTVTKEEFQKLDAGHQCPGGPRHPVTEVSWYMARLFARWAGCRLPTEAEWEYACRAGTTTAWSFGEDDKELGKYAWFAGNGVGSAQPVGEKLPNPWGLYDMHGNVWECCADWLCDYPSASQADQMVSSGQVRVGRGGNCWYPPARCRSAHREWIHPATVYTYLGFRVLRSLTPSAAPDDSQ